MTTAGDFEVRFSGSGGQGLQLSAQVLAEALVREGFSVALSQSYEPTSRGGLSRADLVVGESEPDFPLAAGLDFLLVLDQCAAGASLELTKPETLVLLDRERVLDPPQGAFTVRDFDFLGAARQLGNDRVANIVALGCLVELAKLCPAESLETALRASLPARFLDVNLEAVRAGRAMAAGEPGKDR